MEYTLENTKSVYEQKESIIKNLKNRRSVLSEYLDEYRDIETKAAIVSMELEIDEINKIIKLLNKV
jgi:hypothetical protein